MESQAKLHCFALFLLTALSSSYLFPYFSFTLYNDEAGLLLPDIEVHSWFVKIYETKTHSNLWISFHYK